MALLEDILLMSAENSLIKTPILGSLRRPLSALVFHFGQYISRLTFRPCEAAFLAYSLRTSVNAQELSL